MLVRLTRALGKRTAGVLVVLYGLCILAPAAALAFGDAATAAHCLTDDHHTTATPHLHGAAKAHVHADGTAHEHPAPQSGDDENSQSSNCCGLMCLPAIPAAMGMDGDEPLLALPGVPTLRQNMTGCGPGLLYRPPISSLSL